MTVEEVLAELRGRDTKKAREVQAALERFSPGSEVDGDADDLLAAGPNKIRMNAKGKVVTE
jgi:hypothetical protein